MTVVPGSNAARAGDAAMLKAQGYCILADVIDPTIIARLDRDLAPTFAETPFGQGAFYGGSTKRFGRLLSRSDETAKLVLHHRILALVNAVLADGCDTLQLNVAQAIAIHPGERQQMPHRDEDMWRAPPGAMEYLVNVIWPLTPFTADNGATLLWPGSHGAARRDDGVPIAAEMCPGSALVFLGSTLHGAGPNQTQSPRRGVVVGYALGWLKPYENQWLAYPPTIARHFPPALAALVGYRQHRPNLGNYEGQCPSVLLGEDAQYPLGAIDALRPDQEAAVAAFAAAQR